MTSCKPVGCSRRTLHHEVSKYVFHGGELSYVVLWFMIPRSRHTGRNFSGRNTSATFGVCIYIWVIKFLGNVLTTRQKTWWLPLRIILPIFG